ncbi:MAG TPA: DUF2586 family protein [Polyangiaceae bacterium]|nr:DUF2586 family protein [Polyangiaceae bacterium]
MPISVLPDVTVDIQDGALGLVPINTFGIHVKLGVCTTGKPNTLYSFSAPSDVVATLGTGPLVEAGAYTLSVAGGPVYLMPVQASVPGAVGALTVVRAPGTPSTGTFAVAGAPLDGYAVVATIVQGATVGGSPGPTFTLSLDGGTSQSAILAVPTTGAYPIAGTGLTITFAGAFNSGDSFAFSCAPPSYSLTDLATALQALLADPRTWGFLHVVGTTGGADDPAKATAAAALFAALAAFMAQAKTRFRYARAVIEAPRVSDGALATAFQNQADTRVMVCAGYETLTSTVTGRQNLRSAAWPVTARAASVRVSEDLGRVATGPLPGVVSLDRDEQQTPGLDAQRFATLRTIIGRQGFYITNPNIMAPSGSDFSLWQNARVMDVACAISRNALLQYLNDAVRVDAKTGFVNPKDAIPIERYTEGQVRAELVQPGDASDVTVTVARTDNILSTRTLRVSTRVLPLAYSKYIEETIGFSNPALQLVAA